MSKPIQPNDLRCKAPEEFVCQEPKADTKQPTPSIQASAQKSSYSVWNKANVLRAGNETLKFMGNLLLFAVAGCTDHPRLTESPKTDPATDPSNVDNPPVVRGGADGTGQIDQAYAESSCEKPLDLDPSSKDENSLLMTCGDDVLSGNSDGIGLIEKINVTNGEISEIKLPGVVDGDESRPVYLSATVAPKNGIILAGFSPSGSPADFQADSTRFANSGVYFLNEDNTTPQTVTFESFERTVGEKTLTVSLSNHQTLNAIQPNSPVSMTWLNETAYLVNANYATHPSESKKILNAPVTIHPFQINENGNITAGDPYLVDGSYYPTAIAAVDAERFAVVVRGVDYNQRSEDVKAEVEKNKKSGIITPNPSKLLVFDKNFASGFNPGPDSAGSYEVPLADAGIDEFVANNSRQVSVVEIGGVPHALIGSADTTGRVAIVNLDRDPPKLGTSRVQYTRAFDDGSDIANIVVTEDQKYAYVISSNGEVVTMTLDPAKNYRVTDNAKQLVDFVPDSGVLPAARSGNVIMVASPGTYSAAGIVKAE